MDDFLEVDVRLRDGRKYAEGRYRMPVRFGRGAGNDIRFPEEDHRISRKHACVELANGRLTLEDRSANGVTVGGRRLQNGQKVEIGDGSTFEIIDYVVRVTRARRDPKFPVLFDATVGTEKGGIYDKIPIGELMLIALRRQGRFSFAGIPIDADFDNLFGRYRLEGSDPLFVIVGLGGKGTLISTDNGRASGLHLNRIPVTATRLDIRPLDVISLKDIRVDLLVAGNKHIKCVNPKCGLLNEYNRHENCRWCGRKLQEGDTVVVPKTR